jgi:hypothetical protein
MLQKQWYLIKISEILKINACYIFVSIYMHPLDIAYCGRHIYECGWFAGGISAIFLP